MFGANFQRKYALTEVVLRHVGHLTVEGAPDQDILLVGHLKSGFHNAANARDVLYPLPSF